VLDSGLLWYYELALKGSIPLADGAGVYAGTKEATLPHQHSTFGGLRSTSDFAYRLTISHSSRLYHLAADTEQQMADWIEGLQKAIRKDKPLKSASLVGAQYAASAEQKAPEGDVTFVFTDVQNSTKLWELASTAMNISLEKHDALLRLLLKQFNGYEVKTEGDAFMVTFFNLLDAIRWCLAVQLGLLEIVWPEDLLKQPAAARVLSKTDNKTPIFNGIRIRMGIHTGQPSCRRNPITGRMDYFGPTVNRSARVSDSAHGGQIVCTQEVYDVLAAAQKSGEFKKNIVVEELGSFPYKGISELVKVYQLSSKELVERNPFPALRVEEPEEPKEDKTEKKAEE
jgi:class 3 adenylate cyclase